MDMVEHDKLLQQIRSIVHTIFFQGADIVRAIEAAKGKAGTAEGCVVSHLFFFRILLDDCHTAYEKFCEEWMADPKTADVMDVKREHLVTLERVLDTMEQIAVEEGVEPSSRIQ